jgi:hypothetical protein
MTQLPSKQGTARLVRTINADEAQGLRLRRQWVIQPAEASTEWAWPSMALGLGYVLQHHPDTIVRQWGDEGDGVWLLGVAASDERTGMIDFATPASRSHDAVVASLRSMAGMYVLVRVDAEDVHCYTDPAAMMGMYHKDGCVASTPALLGALARDDSIDCQYTIRGSDDWYTGRITPFTGVRCVLANHCFSIRRGTESRFWPNELFAEISHDEGVSSIAKHFVGVLGSLSEQHPLLVSLTAGRDSRINLAACRGILDRVSCFTLRGAGVHPKDVAVPGRLAERFGFAHRYVELEATPGWLDVMYDEMTSGLVIGSRRRILGACRHLVADDAVHVNGNLGATALGFFWDSASPSRVSEKALLKEFVQKPDCIRNGVREWIASVPELPASVVYNLMYFEQRGGRWMGPGETASQIFYNSFSPFCSRVFFELLSGMPVSSQRGDSVLRGLVEELWLELLCEPYCSGTNLIGRAVPKRLKVLLQAIRPHG